jgi:cyclophilin family peptidyl-prolyl cis-trans isomerase
MKLQSIVYGAVAGVLVGASAFAGQVDLSKSAKLRDPAALTEQAPAKYTVNLDTSKGPVVIEVHRDWAPLGADRFYNLVKNGYYDGTRFYRVIDGFMAQIGIHGTPAVDSPWMNARIKDDAVKQSNKRGFVSFATGGPNTRTTQFFINYRDNSNLDKMGFAPFGEVVKGMEVVDQFYNGYGEGAPNGRGPSQGRIHAEGNAYLNKEFPKLDYIKTATIAK